MGIRRRAFMSVCVVMMACGMCMGAEEAGTVENHRADWFKDARWGVFTHYMADTVIKGEPLTVDTWNATVDSFDVAALADRLAAIGAGYYVITLGQNSGYYCSPNATYDKYVEITPSKCAKRDLIADLYEALHPKGIRLMVYLPSGAPDRDEATMTALEWRRGNFRLSEFQRKWEDVIREWSLRWGTKVSGWWFDGCYYADAMYRHPDPPNFESLAAAARAGNPDSIVAFNPGVLYPIVSVTPFEDYTAGEINEPDKVTCEGRWVDAAQFHMLSYLGPAWAQAPPRFSDEQVIAFTRGIVDKGGVVTWDVPIGADGAIPPAFLDQFRALHEALPKPGARE